MIDKFKSVYSFFLKQDKALYHAFASISSLRAVEKLSGLLISIFIFRFLTKDEVAAYGFIQTIVAVCAIFGLQELQNTISQSVSRGFRGTFIKSVPVAFLSSVVGSFVLSAFSYWYFLTNSSQMGWGFLIAAVIFPFFQGLRQWRGLYLGEKKFTTFAKAEASNAIIKALLIVASLYLFPHEIIFPILIFFSIPAFQNIFQTYINVRKKDVTCSYEEGSIAYGFRANFYSAAGTLANHIDKIILFAFLPPAALALYMAAEKFSDLMQGAVQDMAAILSPKFATMGAYSSALDKKLKFLAMAMGGAILVFALLILPHLLPLVFGQAYHDSVLYSQILVCGAAVRNIATLRFRFIRSKIDEKSYRQVTVYSAVAHILASIILVPLFGLYGAVASVFLHRLILSVIVDYIIRTRYLAHE
jgi:O-antigen/teichoic acid export membrane protein